MLRSWTEWRARLQARQRPAPRYGIAVGRARIDAASLVPGPEGLRADWERHEILALPLFEQTPSATLQAELTELWTRLLPEATRIYCPVHVALPDAALQFALFEIDVLPKGEPAQQELVTWLFAREHQLDTENIACTWKNLGAVGDRQLLLAAAMPRMWLNVLSDSLRAAGVVAWTMDALMRYRFNFAQTQFAAGGESIALLAVEHESWTFTVVDALRRPRYVRARWREFANDASGPAPVDIAEEIERLLRQYVTGQHDRQLTRFYVTGSAPDVNAIAQALDVSLQIPTVRLATGIGREGSAPESVALAVGAAG